VSERARDRDPLEQRIPGDVRLSQDVFGDANLGASVAHHRAATPVPNAADFSSEHAAPRKLYILVVDDIAMNRDIAGSFLRAAGHVVVDAGGGLEALAAVAAEDFDVVLMDVRMPEIDGLEATRRIRALEGPRRDVPIVALTAQAFSEQVRQCHEAGMDGHVSKPFTPETLLAAVLVATAQPARAAINNAAPETRRISAPVTGDNRPDCTWPDETSSVSTLDPDLALPALDHGAFQRTAAFLSPKVVADYLQIIVGGCQSLLSELDGADVLGHAEGTFAETAYSLAGSAGMFGFGQLSAAARRFAGAIQAGANDVPCISQRLRVATQGALQEIYMLSAATPVA